MATLVLGAGIVGSAAVWDLRRRGHEVTVADANVETVERIASAYGATPATIDVAYGRELMELVGLHDIVVSAVPYRFGYAVASAALATNTHYLDFGGNPTVVAAQKRMHEDAVANEVMLVPDCGLAPGLANVIAHVDRVLGLLEAGKLDPAPLVTHRMKLDQAAEAYALYDNREALKIVLTP